jgi:hypothetical protein
MEKARRTERRMRAVTMEEAVEGRGSSYEMERGDMAVGSEE